MPLSLEAASLGGVVIDAFAATLDATTTAHACCVLVHAQEDTGTLALASGNEAVSRRRRRGVPVEQACGLDAWWLQHPSHDLRATMELSRRADL